MATVVRAKTFAAGDVLTANDLNGEIDGIITQVNGNLDDTNVKAGAQIVESKVLFSNTGHDHSGGSDGSPIAVGSSNYGGIKIATGTVIVAAGAISAAIPYGFAFSDTSPFLLLKGHIAGGDDFMLHKAEMVAVAIDANQFFLQSYSAFEITVKWIALGV